MPLAWSRTILRLCADMHKNSIYSGDIISFIWQRSACPFPYNSEQMAIKKFSLCANPQRNILWNYKGLQAINIHIHSLRLSCERREWQKGRAQWIPNLGLCYKTDGWMRVIRSQRDRQWWTLRLALCMQRTETLSAPQTYNGCIRRGIGKGRLFADAMKFSRQVTLFRTPVQIMGAWYRIGQYRWFFGPF